MYLTVKGFVSRLWYIQEFILIEQREFERCQSESIEKMSDYALFRGSVSSTRSDLFKKYNDRFVKSYGVVDGVTVVIV